MFDSYKSKWFKMVKLKTVKKISMKQILRSIIILASKYFSNVGISFQYFDPKTNKKNYNSMMI